MTILILSCILINICGKQGHHQNINNNNIILLLLIIMALSNDIRECHYFLINLMILIVCY